MDNIWSYAPMRSAPSLAAMSGKVLTFALFALLAFGAGATEPYVLWIDRPVAQPWLLALDYAAWRSGLPSAVIGELIGQESGYRNAANPHSSARGFGQQVTHNSTMSLYRLDRMKPPESILGAALELRERLDATGSMFSALRGYGTTAGMSAACRLTIETRFALAMKKVAAEMVAQQIAPIGTRRN